MSEQRRAAPRRQRRRRKLFLLLSLGLGLLLAAIATEIGFRVFWQMPAQFAMFEQTGLLARTSAGGVTLVPGFEGRLDIRDGLPTELRVNSLGMRGEDVGSKRAGERRVLMLGDSLVFGYAVGPDDTLPRALARELAAHERHSTVGNGGIPGFGTKESAERMAWLDPGFEPDAFVFCGYLGNDAVDDLRIDKTIRAGLRFAGHMARVADESLRFRFAMRSRAWLWVETWIFTNKREWSPLTQIPPSTAELVNMSGLPGTYPTFGRARAGLFLDVVDIDKTWAPNTAPIVPRVLDNVRRALVRAKEIAGERPLVFAVLPTLWQVDESGRRENLEKLQFDVTDFERGLAQRRWLEVASQLGIPAVDVTAALAAIDEPASLYVDDGGHFNRRGAEIAAREIAAALVPLLE